MVIRYIEYKDIYKDQIICLLKKGLSEDFSNERFDWLHLENPLGKSNMILAIDNEKVVGFSAVIKKRINIAGKSYIAGRDIDPTVHPEYRGRGIFSTLLDLSLEKFKEIDIYFNFGNDLSSKVFVKKGWKPLHYDRYYYVVNQKFGISKYTLAAYFSSINLKEKSYNLSVTSVPLNNLSIEEPNHNNEFPIYIFKDLEYINWRYSNPNREYQFYKIGTEKFGYGFIIAREENEKMIIVDLINNSELNNSEILKNFIYEMKSSKKKILITTWSQITKQINNSMWHIPRIEKSSFYVRAAPNKKFDIDIYDVKNWYMVPGESEFM